MKKILAIIFCLLLAFGVYVYAAGVGDEGIGDEGIGGEGVGGEGVETSGTVATGDALMLETPGDYIKLETDDYLLLE